MTFPKASVIRKFKCIYFCRKKWALLKYIFHIIKQSKVSLILNHNLKKRSFYPILIRKIKVVALERSRLNKSAQFQIIQFYWWIIFNEMQTFESFFKLKSHVIWMKCLFNYCTHFDHSLSENIYKILCCE